MKKKVRKKVRQTQPWPLRDRIDHLQEEYRILRSELNDLKWRVIPLLEKCEPLAIQMAHMTTKYNDLWERINR